MTNALFNVLAGPELEFGPLLYFIGQDASLWFVEYHSHTKGELVEEREICWSNLVKQDMMNNRIATSFGLRLYLSRELPLIVKRAGYSAVLMNLEHAPTGIETMRDISVACLNVG